jgi:hypothetical protein
VIRELGASYKSDSYFLKVFATELSRVGKQASPGERLEYVVVKTEAEIEGDEVKLGLKMRDIDMWEDSWSFYNGKTNMVKEKEIGTLKSLPEGFAKILGVKTSKNEKPNYPAEKIDTLYYVEHSLMNPFDQLYSIGYNNRLPKYEGIGYTPQYSRCHYCPITTPLKMIGKLVTDLTKGGFDEETIIEAIGKLKDMFRNGMVEVDQILVEEKEAEEKLALIKAEREARKGKPVKKSKVVSDSEDEIGKKKKNTPIKKSKVVSDSEDETPKNITIKKKKVSDDEVPKKKKITIRKKKVESSEEEAPKKKITIKKKKVESSDDETPVKVHIARDTKEDDKPKITSRRPFYPGK